jgi:hypothetical protein
VTSSSGRPFVSGRKRATKATARIAIAAALAKIYNAEDKDDAFKAVKRSQTFIDRPLRGAQSLFIHL